MALIVCQRLDKTYARTATRGEQRIEDPNSVEGVLQALQDLQPDKRGLQSALAGVEKQRHASPLACLEAMDRVYTQYGSPRPTGKDLEDVLWVFGPTWRKELLQQLGDKTKNSTASFNFATLRTCAIEYTTFLQQAEEWLGPLLAAPPAAAAGQARQPHRHPWQQRRPQQQQQPADDGDRPQQRRI